MPLDTLGIFGKSGIVPVKTTHFAEFLPVPPPPAAPPDTRRTVPATAARVGENISRLKLRIATLERILLVNGENTGQIAYLRAQLQECQDEKTKLEKQFAAGSTPSAPPVGAAGVFGPRSEAPVPPKDPPDAPAAPDSVAVRHLRIILERCSDEKEELRDELSKRGPVADSTRTRQLRAQLEATKLRLAELENTFKNYTNGKGSTQELMQCKLKIVRLSRELEECKNKATPPTPAPTPAPSPDVSDVPTIVEEAKKLLQKIANKNADPKSIKELQANFLVIEQRLEQCEADKKKCIEEQRASKLEMDKALEATEKLSKHATQYEEDNKRLRVEIEDLNQQLTTPSAPPLLSEALKAENDELKTTIDEYKQAIKGLEKRHKEVTKELQAKLDRSIEKLIDKSEDMEILSESYDQTEEEITNLKADIAQLQGQLQACRDKPPAPPPPGSADTPPPTPPPAPAPAPDNGGGFGSFLPSIGSIPNPFNIFGGSTPETPGTPPETPDPTPDPTPAPGAPVTREVPVEEPVDPLSAWDGTLWGGLTSEVIGRAKRKGFTSLDDMIDEATENQWRGIVLIKEDWRKVARRAGTDYDKTLNKDQISGRAIKQIIYNGDLLQPPLRF
tara:strand:+ start:912 stop:2765 length:1854 start_codon:yes stop_codon:yes gene_type:complete